MECPHGVEISLEERRWGIFDVIYCSCCGHMVSTLNGEFWTHPCTGIGVERKKDANL